MNSNKIKTDVARLTPQEKTVYNSILENFPGTSHESALNHALQGGIDFQFYPQ